MILPRLTSAKGDDIIYIAFNKLEDLHEFHVRVAECQNSVIATRNYIPPQMYERYIYLSKMCAEVRASDPETKIQLRFGGKCIEILTIIK